MDAAELREQYPDLVSEIERDAINDYIENERRGVERFTFYRTYWLSALALPKSARADFVMGILDYAFTGREPMLDKAAEAAFISARPNIDNSVDSVLFGKQGGRPRKPHEDDHSHDQEIEQVIDYLNTKAGKKFKPTTGDARRYILARIREGFSVEDFKRVVDNMTAEWGRDDKMRTYLRPSTLFGPKFDSYLNNSPATGGGDYDKYR